MMERVRYSVGVLEELSEKIKAPVNQGESSGGLHDDIWAWEPQDVKTWLEGAGLGKYKKWFDSFDGSLLVEYYNMQRDAPQFFYTTLKNDMKFSVVDILKFTKALKHAVRKIV